MIDKTSYETINKKLSEIAENMPPGEQHGTETWKKWHNELLRVGKEMEAQEEEISTLTNITIAKKFLEISLETAKRIENAGLKHRIENFDEAKQEILKLIEEADERIMEEKQKEEDEKKGYVFYEGTGKKTVKESFLDRGEWNENIYIFLDFFMEKQLGKIIDGLYDEWDKIQKEYRDPKDPEYVLIPPGTMAAVYWDVKINGIPICLHFRYWGEEHKEGRKKWVHPPQESEGIHIDIEKGDPKIDVYVYEGTTKEALNDEGTWRAYYSDLDSFINHFWRYNLLNDKGEPANKENDERLKIDVDYIKTWDDQGLPFELPDDTGIIYTPELSEIKDDETGETILSKDSIGSHVVNVYSSEQLKKYMIGFRRALDADRKIEKIWKRMTYYGLKASMTHGELTEKEDIKNMDKLTTLFNILTKENRVNAPSEIAEYYDPESYLLFHRLGHVTDWSSPDRVVPPWLTEEEYDQTRATMIAKKLIKLNVMDRLEEWNKKDDEKIMRYVLEKTGEKLPDDPYTQDMTDAQKQAIKEILVMKQETWEKNGGPQMFEEECNKRKDEIEQHNKDPDGWAENKIHEQLFADEIIEETPEQERGR